MVSKLNFVLAASQNLQLYIRQFIGNFILAAVEMLFLFPFNTVFFQYFDLKFGKYPSFTVTAKIQLRNGPLLTKYMVSNTIQKFT